MTDKVKLRLLAVLLCIGFLVQGMPLPAYAAIGEIQQTSTYSGQFADVDKSAWYYSAVAEDYSYGLVDGSGGKFNPSSKVTLAEVVTFAARIACLYNGGDPKSIIPTDSSVWYSGYLKYLQDAYVIGEGEFDGRFENDATRAEVAQILADTLPISELTDINSSITAVPDMKNDAMYYNAVLTLYRAGVVTGSDAYGNFYSATSITRAELAAIINRLVNPAQRVNFTPLVGAVTFDRPSLNLRLGMVIRLSALPKNGAYNGGVLSWHTDNSAIATVAEDGTVTAVSDGKTTIWTSESNGKKNSPDCVVTVGDSEPMTAEDIYTAVSPAVFYIEASRTPISGGYTGNVAGSGFFVNADGTAYTNLHVIDGQNILEITTADGKYYNDISIIGYDRLNDIAVLKVNGGGSFPSLALGDSEKVEKGEPVYCIGNPLGLQNSISNGLVSGLQWHPSGTYAKASYLQISAPISHGSSGGVAVNQYGEAIGITSGTLGNDGKINLAVPINVAKAVKGFSPLTPKEFYNQTFGQASTYISSVVIKPTKSNYKYTNPLKLDSGNSLTTSVIKNSPIQFYSIHCDGRGMLYVQTMFISTAEGFNQLDIGLVDENGKLIDGVVVENKQNYAKFYIDTPGTYTFFVQLDNDSTSVQPYQLYVAFINDEKVGQ